MKQAHRHLALLWLLVGAWAVGNPAFAQPMRFQHLTAEEGLLSNNVMSIVQDHRGWLWVGTSDGLNRYDGHRFWAYQHRAEDSTSICGTDVNLLYEDHRQNLWIGTEGYGLCRYVREQDHFATAWELGPKASVWTVGEDLHHTLWAVTQHGVYHYVPQGQRWMEHGLPELGFDTLAYIAVGLVRGDTLWLGTEREGLFAYSLPSLRRLAHYPQTAAGHPLSDLRTIAPSQGGGLWLTDPDYLAIRFFPASGRALVCRHQPGQPNSLRVDRVQRIGEWQGRAWFSTENGGLSILDLRTQQFEHYQPDPETPGAINDASVYVTYPDREGRWWVGTFSGGLNLYDPFANRFSPSPVPLPNRVVNSVLVDKKGLLWVGTEGGLVRHGPLGAQLFALNSRGGAGLPVTSVAQDAKGQVWAAVWTGGLARLDKAGQSFSIFAKGSSQLPGLPSNQIFHLHYGQKSGRLWGTTLGEGVFYVSPEGKVAPWRPTVTATGQPLPRWCIHVLEDRQGGLWVGSYEGLVHQDPVTGQVVQFRHDARVAHSLSNDEVRCIHQDTHGQIWVGTELGLSRWLGQDKFEHFTTRAGLPSNQVNSIIEDQRGRLWVGTGQGLARFDRSRGRFRAYDRGDGLPGNQLKSAAAVAPDGRVYLGGVNGLAMFHPDSLLPDNSHVPPVVFTKLEVGGLEVLPGHPLLPKALSETQQLVLNHQQAIFTIHFTSLTLSQASKTKFSYFLEGLEPSWNAPGPRSQATYTSLPPGDYTLRVRACNHDGVWPTADAQLRIRVLPPWWSTWWFRAGLAFLVLALPFAFYRYRLNLVRERNRSLEAQVSLRTAALTKANHELRLVQAQMEKSFEELAAKTEVIDVQNQQLTFTLGQIEAQKQQILDSILYAQTIQRAILPTKADLAEGFGQLALIYRPKDIVSGDFYWIGAGANARVLAVADCTGHGVPGAFMSIIGITLLNEIVNLQGHTDPAQVLTLLDERVRQALRQAPGQDRNNHDGLDLALCTFVQEPGGTTLHFCGAKRPLWVRRATGELLELPADRKSVGGRGRQAVYAGFVTQTLALMPGDRVYAFTDGLTDQPNPGRHKFGYGPLRQTVALDLPLAGQRDHLEQALVAFMGDQPQRDDITLLAVEI
jgi:ligand-binding sensor domain-containing protein/serine phosphatase RsbU (regulator of sigma subunit)